MGAIEDKPVGSGLKLAISGALGFCFALSIYFYNGFDQESSLPWRLDHDLKEAGLAFVVSTGVIYGVLWLAMRKKASK